MIHGIYVPLYGVLSVKMGQPCWRRACCTQTAPHVAHFVALRPDMGRPIIHAKRCQVQRYIAHDLIQRLVSSSELEYIVKYSQHTYEREVSCADLSTFFQTIVLLNNVYASALS